jgi:hypothetical protein
MEVNVMDEPGTVFEKLVQKIVGDEGFRGAVVGHGEDERKQQLYEFVEQEFPELKEPEELEAKQAEVLKSFNQVLLSINLDEIERLQHVLSKRKQIQIPF